ncbi:hypothetical protein [Rosistilla oblonga]|uniref:hypothetical protein n=1 Tax=Rosistilla oblonga TaxID=2527990 RepID=UPI003A97DC83
MSRDTDNSTAQFYAGWDVGAWNCDKNPRSRDAIVILDSRNQIVGKPWGWKNLRTQINDASSTDEWIKKLFDLCDTNVPDAPIHLTLAIDTPLGFSDSFRRLVENLESVDQDIGSSSANPYLFRDTELFLFRNEITPLSAIKDMIGSQATKGMHVLSKFAPQTSDCGIWSDGRQLTVIEAYPSACKGSSMMRNLRHHPPLGRDDIEDALTCALVAYVFGSDQEKLAMPPTSTSLQEGWIFFPKDVLRNEDPA